MTIHDVARQLYDLSVDGYINRERFTFSQWETAVSRWMRAIDKAAVPGQWLIEVALPDGWWHATITHYARGNDGYDYWIPDTREQESRLLNQYADIGD